MSGPSTIDRKGGTGNRGALLACQECRERSDLLDGGETLVRLLGEQDIPDNRLARDLVGFRLVVDMLFDEGRPNIARADGVSRDPGLGTL